MPPMLHMKFLQVGVYGPRNVKTLAPVRTKTLRAFGNCTACRVFEDVWSSWLQVEHKTTSRHGLHALLACRRPLDSYVDPILVH